jgi:hypothetical protein
VTLGSKVVEDFPNDPELRLAVGSPKFGWLNKLKAFAMNFTDERSVILIDFVTPRSTFL